MHNSDPRLAVILRCSRADRHHDAFLLAPAKGDQSASTYDSGDTKHGEGPAAKQLREKRPELFIYPALRKDDPDTFVVSPLSLPLGGDGLYVTGDEFHRYHKTVLDLFEMAPEIFRGHGEEYYPR